MYAMYVYVCMYVCMCVCMCKCVCACAHLGLCVYACMCVCVYVYNNNKNNYINNNIPLLKYCTSIRLCMYVKFHIDMIIYVCNIIDNII